MSAWVRVDLELRLTNLDTGDIVTVEAAPENTHRTADGPWIVEFHQLASGKTRNLFRGDRYACATVFGGIRAAVMAKDVLCSVSLKRPDDSTSLPAH